VIKVQENVWHGPNEKKTCNVRKLPQIHGMYINPRGNRVLTYIPN